MQKNTKSETPDNTSFSNHQIENDKLENNSTFHLIEFSGNAAFSPDTLNHHSKMNELNQTITGIYPIQTTNFLSDHQGSSTINYHVISTEE